MVDKIFYTCFEEAISIYAEELYHAKIKDNYLSLEGSPTGSPLNNTVVVPTLNSIITVAENYGTPIQVGGYEVVIKYYRSFVNFAHSHHTQ